MNKAYDVAVVLFIFKRLETVQLIMEQIKKVKPKVLYVFSDGPRLEIEDEAARVNRVRKYVAGAIDWECERKLYFWEINKGCDKNIREGLDLVFSEQKMAIVFEDDAVPCQDFFPYCEELLFKYKDCDSVQYIAGFNAIGKNEIIKEDYTFGKTVPMSGAFATWANRWNECDFDLKDWPQNRDSNRFDDVFFFREMKKRYIKGFNDIYYGKVTAWDSKFEHDMFNKDRMVVVPKNNLATSYGFADGAFHPQEKKEAERLLKIMTVTDESLEFPLNGPEFVVRNVKYDRERQKKMLEVRGNYFQRRFRDVYLFVKGIAYRYLPKNLWDRIKCMVKSK
ncbi:hypothetical protein SAMN02910276_02025 [Butyrivibrio sp. Su6]|uniref:hypothetical protein n=1 Tax=Butyrivibrio sp. Su6 TaxID=1520810 RepID=UPI00089E6572|nr:hypothetical protein [Butyrivibrio sp. Su6]SEG15980.1 hypothetical protein SAMN02910276_02025 [Butyrivibrio sp. Su6]